MRSSDDLVEFIRERSHELGMSLTKIEKEVGLSNGRIGKWKSQKKYPPHDTLVAIASLLSISLEELTGEKEKPAVQTDDGLSDAERKLIELLRQIPEDRQAALLDSVELALRMQGLLP